MSHHNILLSGNEALAYGALEAGLHLATGYPGGGTPSTQIIETLKAVEGAHRIFWHTNEKTALEMVIGCVLHKHARVLVAMKHVGLNVAADPLKSVAVTGITGAAALAACDDRGMHSSQNEFDSRVLCRGSGHHRPRAGRRPGSIRHGQRRVSVVRR